MFIFYFGSVNIAHNVPRLGAVAAAWNDYFLVNIDFPAENRTLLFIVNIAIEPNRCACCTTQK
jgi:hypothetical protein